MKIKNIYVWLCVIWIISTICYGVCSVVNFVDGKIGFGVIFLILSVAVAFVSGIMLNEAIAVYSHNKEVDWLKEISEELREEYYNSIEPFEDFKENKK